VPALIADLGDAANWRYVEFFTANINNDHTHRAYARACSRFFAWCENRGLSLSAIRPFDVAAWVKDLFDLLINMRTATSAGTSQSGAASSKHCRTACGIWQSLSRERWRRCGGRAPLLHRQEPVSPQVQSIEDNYLFFVFLCILSTVLLSPLLDKS
jgi:hypothetical protein